MGTSSGHVSLHNTAHEAHANVGQRTHLGMNFLIERPIQSDLALGGLLGVRLSGRHGEEKRGTRADTDDVVDQKKLTCSLKK